jgi:hypothetical protein
MPSVTSPLTSWGKKSFQKCEGKLCWRRAGAGLFCPHHRHQQGNIIPPLNLAAKQDANKHVS